MEMNQGCVTVKGTSPRVMCPSEASTCQRSRYSPGNNPVACVTSASAGLSLLISSACVKPAAPTSVRRERLASIRTLNRSLIGTSGPATVAFDDGVDSSSTACADATAAIKENAAAERRSFRRLLRRFFMFVQIPWSSCRLRCTEVHAFGKSDRLERNDAISIGRCSQERIKMPFANGAAFLAQELSRLFVRVDLVGMIPINRRIGRRIVGNVF